MELSIGEDNKTFRPRKVESFRDIEEVILNNTYSCGVFNDNHRTNENFQAASCIALDIDGGLTIDAAAFAFKEYKHIIATTRNHGKIKGGKVDDRFRVILFLTEPITDAAVFSSTYKWLQKKFPMADKTSDAARMFYKSIEIFSSQEDGLTIDPVTAPTTPLLKVVETDVLDYTRKPDGWSNCIWAISQGEFGGNSGHEYFMALATFLRKLKFDYDQGLAMLEAAAKKRRTKKGIDYDIKKLKKIADSVLGDRWNGAVYNCSIPGKLLHDYCRDLGENACTHEKSAFSFNTIGELLKGKPEVDWLVNGLLSVGGLSIVVGQPKSGKSTFIRQLAKSVSRGEKFMGRPVKQGKILYLALEEQENMLAHQFKKLGMTDGDNVLIHVGSIKSSNPVEQLATQIEINSPDLVVVDTLLLLLQVENLNSYDEMNKSLQKLRDIARENNTHILTVHHQNKPAPGSTSNRGAKSILGSSAIHGAVDAAWIFNKVGTRRIVNSEQRGGAPFSSQELEYDADTESYKLGVKHDEF